MDRGRVLWTPPPGRRARSSLRAFADAASRRTGRPFETYDEIHRWSIEDPGAFWRQVWDFTGVIGEGDLEPALSGRGMPGAHWFPGARLSFAENLLRHASAAGPGPQSARPALIFECEDEALRRVVTLGELAGLVARARAGLARLGVGPGDRVAAFTPNVPEAVIAMLAASSLGAIWSSCSPDFGPQGVLDRFGQIGPKVLLAADGYVYAGKRHPLGERVRHIVESVPSIRSTVVYPHAGPPVEGLRGQVSWSDLLAGSEGRPAHARLRFDHPLYILYTSGTTGVPKCIVHGAGGTLLKHLEEHVLQVDLRKDDVFFYFTTCG